MTFRVELPLVPSLNHAYGTNKHTGRRFLTKEACAWKEQAEWLIALAAKFRPVVTGPYRLTVLLPTKMRGDVDNRAKLASDALVNAVATPDDSNAVETICRRDASVADGRCILIVEPSEGPAP